MKIFVYKVMFAIIIVTATILLSAVFCYAESQTKDLILEDKITVLEFDIENSDSKSTDVGTVSLISVKKENENIDLLYLNADEQKFYLKDSTGNFIQIVNYDGSDVCFTPTVSLAIVYDDITKHASYYINGKKASLKSEEMCFAVTLEVFSITDSTNTEELVEIHSDCVKNLNAYNIHDSGTADIIAFQSNEWTGDIRIISGVDTLWYDSVGFDVQLYVDGQVTAAHSVSSESVFESVYADDVKVSASQYGYSYFSACIIKNVTADDEKSYKMLVKPFTVLEDQKYYGETAIINVSKEGYCFDTSILSKNTANSKDFFTYNDSDITFEDNFANGNLYLTFASKVNKTVEIYVDSVLVNNIDISSGRNTLFATEIFEGKHTVRISGIDENTVLMGVQYSSAPHDHIASSSAVWNLSGTYFGTVCSECGENFLLRESDTSAFLLTFDSPVSAEAEKYGGFTVVSPSSYPIGTDTDGDKALAVGNKVFYIDVEQSALAQMPYYTVSFDITLTKSGNRNLEISLFSLITNYRNGSKINGLSAGTAYFFKYNVNNGKFTTINNVGNNGSLLTDENSVSIKVGQQYHVVAIVDNYNMSVHIFVDGKYIGKSPKATADVMGNEKCYPSFKFNDYGDCNPIYDNFKISALK